MRIKLKAANASNNLAYPIAFWTAGTERMQVSSNGNVGIGTTSPGAKLQINSPVGAAYAPVLSFTQGANPTYGFSFLQDDLTTGDLQLNRINAGTSTQMLTFQRNTGKVGIGTTSPDEKLTVKGKIHAEEIKIDLSVPAPDYVFDNNYKLPALSDLKSYVDKNHHLPEIPSAKDMAKDGLKLGEMNTLLLKKVEDDAVFN